MTGKRKLRGTEIPASLLGGKQYNLEHTQRAQARPGLSAADNKALGRLVRRYGREAVIAAAETISPRGPGRPPRGHLPYHERMHLAQWIEEQAEEHRQKKSCKPYTEAEIDLYNLLYDGEEQPPDLEKFRKTLKRKRIQGRVELVETLQKWRNHPDATVRREAERKLGQMALIARKTRGDS